MIRGIPADSIRTALDSVFAQPAFAWTSAGDSSSRLAELWYALVRWLDHFSASHPALFKVFVTALIIVLLAIIAHGIWTAWRTMRPTIAAQGLDTVVRVTREQRESLDAAIAEHAAAGRYGEAMRLAFARLAAELESAGILRARVGLTPREVVRAVTLPMPDRARLASLVEQLYRVAFARRACSAADFEAWLQSVTAPWTPRAT